MQDKIQPESLNLQPPAPVPDVTPEQTAGQIKIASEAQTQIQGKVANVTKDLLSLDVHSTDFRKYIDGINAIGNADMVRASSVSNRLLERPNRSMREGGIAEGSQVSKDLVALRRTAEKLTPSGKNLFSPKKLLGFIPFGNQVEDYFRSYQSNQEQLNAITESLRHSKDDLLYDNAAIDEEQVNMWTLMENLAKYSYMAAQLFDELKKKIEDLDQTDPDRARLLKEEVLFDLQQKRQDIAQQQAVNMQGYLTLDLVRRTNKDLIKGIDRANTVTMTALRNAVITAQALSNQKFALDLVQGLNETTNRTIEATANMLKNNSARIAEQATSSGVSIETLQKSFDAVFETLDQVDNYKVKALDAMQQSITGLEAQIQRAQPYLDKERQKAIASTATALPAALTVEG